MRYLPLLLSTALLLTLHGCKIEISAPQEGVVETTSGTYTCGSGETCVVDVADVHFDEEFKGVPSEGYSFAWWRIRDRGLCGGSVTPCRLSTAGFAGNEDLMSLLESDEVFYLEPVFDRLDTWTRKADMPTPRLGLTTVTSRRFVYAIGGYAKASAPGLASFEVFDPILDSWEPGAPLPTPRRWLTAAVVNGIIYAIGGNSGLNQGIDYATVEAYSRATNSWATMAEMPTPRYGMRAAVLNGRIYVVGGVTTQGQLLGTLEVYDPESNYWASKASMPTPRSLMAVEAVKGKLYAIGGGSSPADGLSTVEIFDPETDSWSTGTPMPTARSSVCSTVVNDKIYVIGGGSGGRYVGPIHATVEVYDPSLNSWSTKPPLPTARWALACSASKGRIYTAGGSTDWNMHPGQPTVEAYVPPDA